MFTLSRPSARRRRTGAALIFAAIAILVLGAGGCGLFYGPTTVRSGFVSARLADDDHSAVFTYQRLVYEPARGLAAFPDGGTPRYREDLSLFGTCEVPGGETRILLAVKNLEFGPGEGKLHIVDASGPKVLLARGGTLRRDDRFVVRHLLADTRTGRTLPLDLEAAFAERGRTPGVIRMVDPDGTLLFESPTLAEAHDDATWTRNRSVIPELWVRAPDGRLRRLAATRHYVATLAGEVYYWDPVSREHMAAEIATGAVRPAPEFVPPAPAPAEHGVSIAPHRRTLLYGTRDGDAWRYREIPIRNGQLR